MKSFLGIVTIGLLFLSACTRNEPRRTQAASEERNAQINQMKMERDDYVKSTDARLAEFDQKFDRLDERTSAMTGTTKTNFKDAVDRLRDERKAVGSKLDDLKKVNIESWTTMKGEVDAAVAHLDRSYTELSNAFEKPTGRTPTKPKTY